MAGPGENIEITITGDAKDLTEALEKVSKNIEELQAALGGAKDSFEKTGKSAQDAMKKVKDETDKAADAADGLAGATDKAKKSNDTLAGAVKAASKRLDEQRKIANMQVSSLEKGADAVGRMDSAFASFASVVDQMNPAMAENLRLLGDLAGASEQLILSFTQLGPKGLIIAGVAAIGTAAYTELMAAQQKIIDKNQEMADSWQKQIDGIEALKKLEEDMATETALLTGQISQSDVALQKRTQTIQQMIRAQKNAAGQTAIQRGSTKQALAQYQAEIDRLNELEQKLLGMAEAQHSAAQKTDFASLAAKKQAEALMGLDSSVKSLADLEMVGSVEGIGDLNLAIRSTNSSLHAARTNIIETNTSFVQGEGAAEFMRNSVMSLNTMLQELGSHERFSEVIHPGDDKAWGAINVATREFIGIEQVALALVKARNEFMIREFVEDKKRAAERKRRAEERLRLLEQLEQRAFDTENALKNPIIALQDAHEREMEQLDKLTVKYKSDTKVMEAVERVKVAAAKETAKAVEEATKEQVEQLRSLEREARSALEAIDSISEGGAKDTLKEEMEALEERYARQKQLLVESVQDAMDTEADIGDIKEAQKREELQIEEEFLEAKAELQKKYSQINRDISKQEHEERMDDLEGFLNAMATAAGGFEQIIIAFDEAITYQSMQSKRNMFAAAKAAAISEAIIAGAVAGIATFKDGGITPVNVAEAAALAITTAATVATIAAEQPSFDIGGVVRGGVMAQSRDQVSANLLPGEAVLNRRATEALGEQGVNALNSGGTAASQVVVVPAYKHFDRFIKDEYRRGGSFRNIVTKQREFPVGRRSY